MVGSREKSHENVQTRRLVAIMFTDIVGFTSLAQREEQRALRLLSEHRELMRSIFTKYSGREVKTIGDAFLVEFQSTLEAVRCSFAIQSEIHERNLVHSSEDQIFIRIGIHVGDVIYNESGDIIGDSVNVSSRIEPLATPGGVCISQQAYDQVRNKVEFPLVLVENQKLKNVELPVNVYRLVMPWESNSTGLKQPPLEPRRVAVLPFRNMSSDPNDEYFAEGMTEELITSLSNVKQLTVIARTSVMQYKMVSKKVTEIGRELNAGTLVEGSIRKAANRVRVTVQMIDAQNDGHLWAQNYDRQLEDIFAIQSDIAERVAGELRIKLLDSVKQKMEGKPTNNTEVYTLYLKGKYFWNERSKNGMQKAIEYFELCIKRDPNFGPGYSGLATCHNIIAHNALGEFISNYKKCKEYALRALSLDSNLAEAHAALAEYYHSYERDWNEAESEFKKAIELNPSYATAHQWYSHLLGQRGDFAAAMKEITKARDLDPFSLIIMTNMADGFFYMNDYEGAIKECKEILEINPNFEPVYMSLFQTLVRTRRFAEALDLIDNYARVADNRLSVKLLRADIFAAMSKKEEAIELLKELEEKSRDENLSPFELGGIHFRLEDKDRGFEWLEKAYEWHDAMLNLLKIDYRFDAIRDDPRYLAILSKIGLK